METKTKRKKYLKRFQRMVKRRRLQLSSQKTTHGQSQTESQRTCRNYTMVAKVLTHYPR